MQFAAVLRVKVVVVFYVFDLKKRIHNVAGLLVIMNASGLKTHRNEPSMVEICRNEP